MAKSEPPVGGVSTAPPRAKPPTCDCCHTVDPVGGVVPADATDPYFECELCAGSLVSLWDRNAGHANLHTEVRYGKLLCFLANQIRKDLAKR